MSVFPNGEMALDAAREDPPDLILLDIIMEGMNGFQVCEEIRCDDNLAHIPVIFLSGLTEKESILKGFEAGAVDYITKPFFEAEVLARVKTHISLSNARTELQNSYVELQKQESLRDQLVHMIVHDMRSPLQRLLGYLEILAEESSDWDMQHANHLSQSWLGGKTLQRMMDDMLDVSRSENNALHAKLEIFNPKTLLNNVLNTYISPEERGRIKIDIAENCPECKADLDLCVRIIANLLDNGLKYSPRDKMVYVSVEAKPTEMCIAVSNKGPAIPEDVQELIFKKFGTADFEPIKNKKSIGIGLTFCKLAAEAQGGTIEVESAPSKGSIFTFTLPIQ